MSARRSTATARRNARPPRGPELSPWSGPERQCAGCGGRSAQATLLRIGLAPGGDGLEWRAKGGRGTYVHDSDECRRRFVAGKKRLPGLRAQIGRAAREALFDRAEGAR